MSRTLQLLAFSAAVCGATLCPAQVCQVRNGHDRGTAVCVGTFDSSGAAVFATAGHLCRGAAIVQVAPEGRWIDARVLAWDDAGPGRDFALLTAPSYHPQVTYALGKTSPRVGETVTLAGFERGGPLVERRTRIAGFGDGFFELETPGVGGLSGGPILQGRIVVGILTHNNVDAQRAECTRIETIQAMLRQWRLAEGTRPAAQWSLGVGIGGQCGPGGCRPAWPAGPDNPWAAPETPAFPPQSPGWPGFSAHPVPDDEQPFGRTPGSPDAPSQDLAEVKTALGRLQASNAELELAVKALAATARKPGPPGRDGKDADPAALDGLRRRLDQLEATHIPVQILDAGGKVLDEKRYRLGEPLEFRLVPRSK